MLYTYISAIRFIIEGQYLLDRAMSYDTEEFCVCSHFGGTPGEVVLYPLHICALKVVLLNLCCMHNGGICCRTPVVGHLYVHMFICTCLVSPMPQLLCVAFRDMV